MFKKAAFSNEAVKRMTQEHYNDLALVLAWPDEITLGDERWMALLKKLGFFKNLNFKVGHAGIILIEPGTGRLLYYDYGRYIAPRGLGRRRSAYTDPKLALNTRADFTPEGQIDNLYEIAAEIDRIKEATHGNGRLYFSVATGISFPLAKAYAEEVIAQGSTPYGAFGIGCNSCSRFVSRLLIRACRPGHPARTGLRIPETLAASPISNVVNIRRDRNVYCYYAGQLRRLMMTRGQSFRFMINQLRDNFSKRMSLLLPDDRTASSIRQRPRPEPVPAGAHWLGGVGEGAWYHLITEGDRSCIVTRYNEKGLIDYRVRAANKSLTVIDETWQVTHDSHYGYTTVMLHHNSIRLETVDCLNHTITPVQKLSTNTQ